MTTGSEQLKTADILSPAELGEKTHALITDIATKLKGVSEFGDALHKAFFGRSLPRTNRSLDWVNFKKDDYNYSINFHAEPILSGPEEILEFNSSIRCTIMKYKLGTESATSSGNPVANVHLDTRFIEARDGKISRFIDGSASVTVLNKNQSNKSKYEGDAALEKMPEILDDLFPPVPPVKI